MEGVVWGVSDKMNYNRSQRFISSVRMNYNRSQRCISSVSNFWHLGRNLGADMVVTGDLEKDVQGVNVDRSWPSSSHGNLCLLTRDTVGMCVLHT
ncbi:hypothetical protein J6590_096017 [Homalodisca vitripennis]|nr:hypothetical protein J6590_041962 [Homalodisca vitripennis]KAG8274989.1 hypothetical protein J6590_096017 [Homalodisca vitripennis]